MKINIRLATLNDTKNIADIHSKSWIYAYSNIIPIDIINKQNAKWPIIWQKMLASNINSHYVIVANGGIIGFLTITTSRDDDLRQGFYEIVGLYLKPEYIGIGYGKEAMDWIKKEVQSRGYSNISLWVLEDNIRARKFYEKSGFSADGKSKMSGLADTREVRYITKI